MVRKIRTAVKTFIIQDSSNNRSSCYLGDLSGHTTEHQLRPFLFTFTYFGRSILATEDRVAWLEGLKS